MANKSLMQSYLNKSDLKVIGGGDQPNDPIAVEKGEGILSIGGVMALGGGDYERGVSMLDALNNVIPRESLPNEMVVNTKDNIESPQTRSFQYGGINYGGGGGGSTSTSSVYPTLNEIYQSYGKKPTEDFEGQFQDYDQTKEKNLWQGFWGKVGGAFQGAQGSYSEAAGEARQAGSSFSGVGGRGPSGVRSERRGILGEFVSKVQGELVPGLSTGIQTSRDAYIRDVSGTLAGLENEEGALVDWASSSGDSNAGDIDDSAAGPPGWPTVGAYNQWVNAGSNPDNKVTFGWVDTGDDTLDPTKPYSSDIRLKDDINYLFTMSNGVPIYTFKYKWSDDINIGTMAQDVENIIPDAVTLDRCGYKMVDYSKIFRS